MIKIGPENDMFIFRRFRKKIKISAQIKNVRSIRVAHEPISQLASRLVSQAASQPASQPASQLDRQTDQPPQVEGVI
jgi:hypothetical protein